MSAHAPDEHAVTYLQALRERRADRARRHVHVCTCGAEYAPTPDGRRQHRVLHGHTPTPGGDAA